MSSKEGALVVALADALHPDPHVIPAGAVFFHGTGIPMRDVCLDPPGLSGDKWFTSSQDYAADYAKLGWHMKPHGAVFKIRIVADRHVAKERSPGAWFRAVQSGAFLGLSGWEIERRYIRSALSQCFGTGNPIAGLFKPETDELLLLACEAHMTEAIRVLP